MQDWEVIGRIQSLCAARSWTLYRLAKESGITYSTLCTMLHKATAPSIPTLIKLCRGFNISLSEFFDTNNDWATLTQDDKQYLLQWRKLNKRNQKAAEQYLQFLLSQQTENKQDKG